MKKFLLFVNSILVARYDMDIHGDAIPTEATPVSDEIFWQTINENDGIWTELADGSIAKLPLPVPSISELKQKKRLEINSAFEQSIQQITAGYPASEKSSWLKQESEARAFIANHSAPTPLVDHLSAERGVPKSELVTRILAKSDLFAAASGQLIGKRQRLEDQLDILDESATAADWDAISW